ncbi:SAM-dependent methyltransferase, partial [Xanthomonas oryzae pv. oryzae]
MNATSLPDHAEPRAASWSDRLLRKRLLATLGQLRDGQLQLHEGGTVT